MPVLTIEKPLKQVLGDEGSDSLVRLLNQIQKEQKEDVLEFVEEKFERRLSEEISGINERITEEISGLRGEMKKEIASVRIDMHKNHATLLKWMIGFWATQIAAIIGLLIAFLNQ
ncbi:hypothetical protein H8E88_18810 [candidate division KSB1 bacterium]|nr:hypothetical protein [candidate division KSB1 bacterium]MBL7093333.1 hypothetical protein [candidate division KSB1 bacterium]